MAVVVGGYGCGDGGGRENGGSGYNGGHNYDDGDGGGVVVGDYGCGEGGGRDDCLCDFAYSCSGYRTSCPLCYYHVYIFERVLLFYQI